VILVPNVGSVIGDRYPGLNTVGTEKTDDPSVDPNPGPPGTAGFPGPETLEAVFVQLAKRSKNRMNPIFIFDDFLSKEYSRFALSVIEEIQTVIFSRLLP